jgi:nitrogenase molybdenum-iron protein NifN
MAEIIKRHKAMSVSPLKASQPVGGALAFLGLHRAIPMLHGAQGCTAFAKVFFVRHFREPIPLQTTAMDQVSSVMGADDNIIEGLKAICEKSNPAVIGLLTTGLSETQGTDIKRSVGDFRKAYPQYEHIAVVPVTTPDFTGCAEMGYAAAVAAMIDTLVKPACETGSRPRRRPRQVTVLAGSMLTPGDLEALKEIIECFGLRPNVLPDLSDSLDGHLTDMDFSPVTVGGAPISEFASIGDAAATLVIGRSLAAAADLLRERTGVVDYRFDSLMGLEAVDRLILALKQISGVPVPERIERQRAQLQDAMLDTHFMIGQARIAIAADPDLLHAFAQLLTGMGAEIVAAVAPARAPVLADVRTPAVKIGDLEDLEIAACENGAEMVIGNSHALASAERLGLPLLRIGFPQYDVLGGYQKTWIGYRGTRQALFELANMLSGHERHAIEPYSSVYKLERPGTMGPAKEVSHAEKAVACGGA